jgi:single-strand DNA-binding protein
MSLNRATIIGHLGQDPELRYLPTNGQPVTGFSVATDKTFTGKDGQRQERADWHHVVVTAKPPKTTISIWPKAERSMLKAGCGRESMKRYHAAKRQCTEIIASHMQFLGAPPADAKRLNES